MDKPIRIAQIMGKLWAGGVETVIFNYYEKIDKSKIQFDFYYDADSTVEPPQELIDMGARFYEIPPYQDLFRYIKTLRRYFRENNYTIVHSNINTLSVFPLYAAWKEKIPVRIAHNHSVPGGRELKRNALKHVLRLFSRLFSTHYFACSEKAGRWLFGDKTYEQGKVTVIKNAVDFNKFKRSENEIDELKECLNIQNKFVVGHIGRFTYAKNHGFLIDVFAEIAKKRSDAVLLLVGDGELHDEIYEKARKSGIIDKVIFVGQVSDAYRYYSLVDVMVVPSFYEGLSLTTIESQIAGVPVVISTAIPKEAVISNGCRYLDLKEPVNKWAEAVVNVAGKKVNLSNDAAIYDISKQAHTLSEIYLELC